MQDESLTNPQWNVPPRGPGPGAPRSGINRPVLRTIYSEPAPQASRFIETPGRSRIGPRPTAYQMSGMTGGNKYSGAMNELIMRIMRATGAL